MASHIKITDGAIKKVISEYTKEAGLRNLEREIANLCRGTASMVAQEEIENINITRQKIPGFLGPERFSTETSSRISTPGIVMGLAWTPSGGEILFIEATSMRGGKGLTLTGQLGSVMKESVSTALSYIRSNSSMLGIDDSIFQNIDLHIHVPAGAIPKDGPSAGVTMLTAITSVLKNLVVRKNLAMTGEITLRGQVLPVGGVKEKVLAAHRAGIKNLIIPKQNEKDLYDIPKKVLKSMNFTFAERMVDVLNVAFERRKSSERRNTSINPEDERRGKSKERRKED
jgi:ATP-dependent Lon protease